MKKITIGILAHVDAGKTTLSEGLLYCAGAIRAPGRVDHRDAHLDTDELERERGITIFSKQALFSWKETAFTLLDTPGHVDFSTEMERTLQVLDYAVLVISGTDGVQAHTETLWQLLRRYRVPVFLFVTKMDLPGPGREAVLRELRQRLSPDCVDADAPDFCEEAALREEALLERFLEDGTVPDRGIAALIARRQLFPCCFGSGLKIEGVDRLLDLMERLTLEKDAPPAFGARVYKILRDGSGSRLTCLKLTGGTLSVRDSVSYRTRDGEPVGEKITSIRLYSGEKFQSVQSVSAGSICAVLGLSATFAGQGLGAEAAAAAPLLEPVMTYGLQLPKDCDQRLLLQKLRQLEEEDPQLHLSVDQQEIQLQLMGEVQTEVLKRQIKSRFDVDVQIGDGKILYKETIAAPVEGVGHFEPLRHYAEVHLLLEPLPQGAGLQFGSCCSEDILDKNWQRLILTHLQEKQHLGVLTGSPITDLKITLAAGRAHPKHTEGGDFRQATYRAVRQGLMQAKSILLEPMYSFRLEVPQPQIGRAIQDLRARFAQLSSPEPQGEFSVLEGVAPVAALRGYPQELTVYTRGRGRFSCRLAGYAPCHNQEEVVSARQYRPESDLPNTPDSVFCAHGAGFPVKWDQVPRYMHLESCQARSAGTSAPPRVRTQNLNLDEKELMAILDREFGPIRRPQYRAPQPTVSARTSAAVPAAPRRTVLLVDGYNVIFSWDSLRELAACDLDGARQALMELLCNYRAFVGCELILVFDAYRVRDGRGEKFDHRGIHVVFTRENETGDQYMERLSHEIGKNDSVRVVTSDSLIQLSALRAGVLRMSVSEFREELDRVGRLIAEKIKEAP